MSNNPSHPSSSSDVPRHQQDQPTQAGIGSTGESGANAPAGRNGIINPDVPSVVMPAVTELVSGRVSPRSMLHVVPEAKRQKGAGTRRAFQPRRRSRACDQCRTRKTKCDTPNDGPCSSCVAASLECHFSEGGDERRRAGPTRRLRAYEALTKELQEKLDRANALLVSAGYAPILSSTALALTAPSSPSAGSLPDRSAAYSGRSASTYMGSSPTAPVAHQNILSMGSDPQEILNTAFPQGHATGPMGGFMSSQLHPPARESREARESTGRSPDEGSTWDGGFYGPSSCASFAMNYREYLVRLGFAPPPLLRRLSQTRRLSLPNNGSSESIPSRSENAFPDLPSRWPLRAEDETEVDLRSLLPERAAAEECKEVYRKILQKYLPAFYWPMLEKKWERAWGEPIWERDKEAVRSRFCIVVLLLAISCQMIEGWAGNTAGSEERQGWVYFLMANHFHDEYPHTYNIDDATIFLLMSVYLINASLPSPCWMMIGATCRVFQDLGLHKQPPPNKFTRVDQESRNRLFWAAYVLDRQIGIVFGRPVIFQDQDIDVKLPGETDGTGVGIGESESAEGTLPEESASEGEPSDISLNTYRALVQVCKCFHKVRSSYPLENGSEDDILRLREVEHDLDKAWNLFPPELRELSSQPLEVGALRPLLDAQHARLLLFRSFTDFSKSLHTSWRTFCLAQSIHTCKISARLLMRCTYMPDWDNEFALKSNETVRVHIFRAAALLLLGYSLSDPAIERVERDEVIICIKALKAASERHHSMMKPMQMIEGLARMFGCDIQDVQGPLERQKDEEKKITMNPPGGEASQGGEGRQRAPSDPMEWANYQVGGGGHEKRQDRPEQASIPSQIPQHGLQGFSNLSGSPQAQSSAFQIMRNQTPLFSPSESHYESSTRSGYQTSGALTPLAPETSTATTSGLTTPTVVSSLGGLMLSPSMQNAPSSALPSHPMTPLPSSQMPLSTPRSNMPLRPFGQQQQQPQQRQMQPQEQHHPLQSQHPLLSPNQHFPPTDLSSTGGNIDWDAFQNMMLVDNHGFGELLASGPEVAWGYLQNSGGVPGVPGLNSMDERGGYAGGPTTAQEDRRRAGQEQPLERHERTVKSEEWPGSS